jgi:parvulin-like peptidyl-prolyl isomerase
MSPSKEQGRKRKPAPVDRSAARRRFGLVGFGALFVALFVIVAIAQGLSDPSPSGDEVAIVDGAPNDTITQEDLDASLEQTAAGQGLQEVPPEDDPQYEQLRDAAIDRLIVERWLLGEVDDLGIEITDREIEEERDAVIQEQFGGSAKEFDRFLEDSGYTQETVTEQLELQVASTRIQEEAIPQEPEINEDEIETFYEENETQFEQPESRDVRVILTKSEAKANDALAELEEDSTPKGFERVAKQFSTDEATKATGGLREGVVAGQSEPALDEEIFAAPEGELVGPFETESGFYVIQVEGTTPASTVSLDEARPQIEQTLVAARQQELGTAFEEDFIGKWRARTFCGDDYLVERCGNAPPPPSACTEELAESTGCGAAVPSTKPIEPGTAGVFGAPAPTGKPQGPISPQAAAPEVPGLPPGTDLPPGAAPQGAAPQAPPQGAAPQAPPEGAAPQP